MMRIVSVFLGLISAGAVHVIFGNDDGKPRIFLTVVVFLIAFALFTSIAHFISWAAGSECVASTGCFWCYFAQER